MHVPRPAAELTHYPRDLAEMALAHTLDSEVEAAYRRGDMLAKRGKMMQAWADFLKPAGVYPPGREPVRFGGFVVFDPNKALEELKVSPNNRADEDD